MVDYTGGKYSGGKRYTAEEWAKAREGARGPGIHYGERTAAKLGLQPGRGYTEKDTEDWFNRLRLYSAFLYNNPQYAQGQQMMTHWTRGAQLGLSPEAYTRLWETIKETGRPMSAAEAYIFGRSDVAPEGYQPIEGGLKPIEIGGPTKDYVERFTERFPSTADYMRAEGYPSTWRGVYERPGTFAPKIRTVNF